MDNLSEPHILPTELALLPDKSSQDSSMTGTAVIIAVSTVVLALAVLVLVLLIYRRRRAGTQHKQSDIECREEDEDPGIPLVSPTVPSDISLLYAKVNKPQNTHPDHSPTLTPHHRVPSNNSLLDQSEVPPHASRSTSVEVDVCTELVANALYEQEGNTGAISDESDAEQDYDIINNAIVLQPEVHAVPLSNHNDVTDDDDDDNIYELTELGPSHMRTGARPLSHHPVSAPHLPPQHVRPNSFDASVLPDDISKMLTDNDWKKAAEAYEDIPMPPTPPSPLSSDYDSTEDRDNDESVYELAKPRVEYYELPTCPGCVNHNHDEQECKKRKCSCTHSPHYDDVYTPHNDAEGMERRTGGDNYIQQRLRNASTVSSPSDPYEAIDSQYETDDLQVGDENGLDLHIPGPVLDIIPPTPPPPRRYNSHNISLTGNAPELRASCPNIRAESRSSSPSVRLRSSISPLIKPVRPLSWSDITKEMELSISPHEDELDSAIPAEPIYNPFAEDDQLNLPTKRLHTASMEYIDTDEMKEQTNGDVDIYEIISDKEEELITDSIKHKTPPLVVRQRIKSHDEQPVLRRHTNVINHPNPPVLVPRTKSWAPQGTGKQRADSVADEENEYEPIDFSQLRR